MQPDACEATLFNDPPCVRMTKREGEALHEVVVKVVGVIGSKVLPPVYKL